MNNTLYKAAISPAYNSRSNSWTFTYWTLNEHLTITSPLGYRRGDLLELVSIENNLVTVVPRDIAEKDLPLYNIRHLIVLSPSMPLGEDANYEFESDTCIVHCSISINKGGNCNYIILASSPVGIPVSILAGVDKSTGTRFEFLVYEIHE